MEKKRFVIVGSGWRSLFYVRIAKALPEEFELCAMLCRTQEKAEAMRAAQGIFTTTSIQECRQMNPDFVVVAVNKASIAEVSKEWLGYGFTVLCETPAALDLEMLQELWKLHTQSGAKLVAAEQYTKYPVYQAMLQILEGDIIGEPYNTTVSLAHDYHGASLIRAFLRTGMQPFTVSGETFTYPTVETMSRYERFRDGRIAEKRRDRATFRFADGKAAFYDFNSEQYRSPIRNHYVNIQGCCGEMKDYTIYYLDQENAAQQESMQIAERRITTGENNPNLRTVTEITGITFGAKEVYTPPFGLCGLAQDETAVARIMAETADYARGIRQPSYPLKEALQDAYMAILMQQAIVSKKTISSSPQPWQEQ